MGWLFWLCFVKTSLIKTFIQIERPAAYFGIVTKGSRDRVGVGREALEEGLVLLASSFPFFFPKCLESSYLTGVEKQIENIHGGHDFSGICWKSSLAGIEISPPQAVSVWDAQPIPVAFLPFFFFFLMFSFGPNGQRGRTRQDTQLLFGQVPPGSTALAGWVWCSQEGSMQVQQGLKLQMQECPRAAAHPACRQLYPQASNDSTAFVSPARAGF